MTDEQLICWAAGFTDGEGCISIGRQKILRATGIYFGYSLGFAISQKKPETLQKIHEMFGGHFFSYKSRGVTYWRWQQWGPGARAALERMLPFLIGKREIAELGIDFHRKTLLWNAEFGRIGYPADIVRQREEFYMRARILNARSKTNPLEPKYEGPQQESARASKRDGTGFTKSESRLLATAEFKKSLVKRPGKATIQPKGDTASIQ